MIRKKLLKAIDPLLRPFGLYTSYVLDAELVGTVPVHGPNIFNNDPLKFARTRDVLRHLQSNGYEDSPTVASIPLEAAKIHPEKGTVHDLSLRKVDPREETNQWHIHIWWTQNGLEIHSHYERRADLERIGSETWSDVKKRLETHYRPAYGRTYIRREHCDDVAEIVE